ncbi:NAD(P)-binding protein [Aspergillus candidus]|uniref:NAD(P)-binding protein n=1 Tax=Aspergillus candidus TaxID=41067 RepID=A0A2I2F5L7_ASPCN|nr:NAD(P)-binding protein [Aspergillus candidus]PLB35856.1 NAD(P)-binding protein [Aspergillus candidus]
MQKCRAANSILGSRAFVPAPRVQFQLQRRNLQDVAITRTGKPLLKVPGHTATVFGATGFLGRYIVHRLASQGCTVVVPYREEMAKRHLKPTGDLGRVNFIEYDLRNTQSIEESVRHSDVVYNLVGRQYPTKNFSYTDVHVDGIERIVEATAKYDIDRYIHVSSYNADKNSPSEYFATKGWGEEVARSIYPETTIVRPAPVFGFEDNLLHKLARVTSLFTANHMQERFWPVHSIDVGTALEHMLHDDSTAGQTFELYGPKNYSTAEIAELVDREIIKRRRHINVPKALLKPFAYYMNKLLWWNVGSADEIEREFIDQKIDPTAKTFKDLGIEPAELENLTFHYLKGYRSASYYDLPPATEQERAEEKKYLHVLDTQKKQKMSPKYPFAEQHPNRPPILLLKTRSSPKDTYEEYFSARGYNPAFVPVLEHRFRGESLSFIRDVIEGGGFTTGVHHTANGGNEEDSNEEEGERSKRYGGLIFTSQRAVEAFGAVLGGMDQTSLTSSFNPPTSNPAQSLPIYTVGPATSRAISALAESYLPNTSVLGEHSGTGDVLAGYILEHYNNLHSHHHNDNNNNNNSDHQKSGKEEKKPSLLFLVGEQRRDIIPKTLMGEGTPAERRIGVEEVVVYETGVMGGFEGDFAGAVDAGVDWLGRSASLPSSKEGGVDGVDGADKRDGGVWVVVFSPTGCDAMVRVLGLDGSGESKRKEGFYVATIGPTTRDHLLNKYGVRADVCAERPSEEGVYTGIEEFMRGRGSS